MSDDDKITTLPVKFKVPPSDDGPMLEVVRYSPQQCNHSYQVTAGKIINAKYLIREGETEVECSLCSSKLDPMFVLRRMATEETKWHRSRQVCLDEMKRLDERKITRCEHCNRMTKISRGRL